MAHKKYKTSLPLTLQKKLLKAIKKEDVTVRGIDTKWDTEIERFLKTKKYFFEDGTENEYSAYATKDGNRQLIVVFK